ncbi:magnesium transporter CorA family protein [bacterium]|nr:magnesium transporter CorA family protein [bacterium]
MGAERANIQVYRISRAGIETHPSDELPSLISQEDGFLWIDILTCDDSVAHLLSDIFGFHPLAIQACREPTHLPKVHSYQNYLFVALQIPELGSDDHIHLLELDQFLGRRYIVTIHEPHGDLVPLDASLHSTETVLHRITAGRSKPKAPIELSYSIVSTIARRIEHLISVLAGKVENLEQRVIGGHIGDPEKLLEVMFHLRHELLTIRTVVAHSREGYSRIVSLAPKSISSEERPFLDDLVDQFDRIRSLTEGEQQFLQGVIDFYQNRTITKLNIAMERLALITVLLLPVTAIASIYGMNIIVEKETQPAHLAAVLVVIMILMVFVFRWAKRQGWW